MKSAIVIGSGFSSLSAACYLAKDGYDVQVLEKNRTLGGRARQLKCDGFAFDMGPTFYWMPDVFEKFFSDFGYTPQDFYHLDRLSPGYEVYFGEKDSIPIADNLEDIKKTFENYEKGSADKLQQFMDHAKSNYDVAIKELVYKPGLNPLEIVTPQTALKLGEFFSTIKSQVAKKISHPKLRTILEFPVLFLGAKSSNTPGFYNFMNYADFVLGTWHPKGGMFAVVQGMIALAQKLGVTFVTDCAVNKFEVSDGVVTALYTEKGVMEADVIVSGADYHHTETLLPKQYRQYSEQYWSKKTFAPSALMFYVGFDRPLTDVSHHTLFFDTDFEEHARSIYDDIEWPESPLFYASFPSKTDDTVAPKGKEAGIFLIPLAPGLEDTMEMREKYFNIIIDRMEKLTQQDVRSHILFKESFCVSDFERDYNSYKGNAYGLANTLLQTHYLRPSIKSKKLKNLFFTGQLTVPGPGVPPSLISGKIAANLVNKYSKKIKTIDPIPKNSINP